MKIELCDLCKNKEPNKKFRIKMSRKGAYYKTSYGLGWFNIWQPYEKICVCEDCAEKLFGIKSDKTRREEMIKRMQSAKSLEVAG